MHQSIQFSIVLTFTLLALGSESQNGERNLAEFSKAIRSAFETHDPDKLRKLSHPSTPKEVADTRFEVIAGAIDLKFDTMTVTTIGIDETPIELPGALPDGRKLKFQTEPDGVIELKLRGGRRDAKVEFKFYFPYKKLDSGVFLCPIGFE